MGLTKQYLRYTASAVFGVIGSQKANIAYVTLRGGERGRYVAVAACEHVFVWDIRKGEKVLILQGNKQEVTYLCPSPDGIHIAVGYEDGSIRIFSLLNGESNVTFNGHKAEVTVIKYDHLGARLVSGSKDTDVIVWDVVNECGLYRLKGHKDAITQTLFLKTKNLLVTSSKDTFVKWWDLETQHCFKTMVGHCSEVWGLVLLSDEKRIISGSADSELRAWDINYLQEVWGLVLLSDEKRIISGSADSELRAWDINYLQEGKEIGEPEEKKTKGLLGHSEEPEGEVDENPEEGTDSLLEVFRVLSDNEINRIMERKLKKAKKKAKQQAGEDEAEAVVDRSLQDEIQRISSIKASSKIRSFDCFLSPNGDLKVALLLQNNTVEVFVLKTAGKTSECTKTARLTIGGHRTDVRTLAFSSDNIAVLSASAETVKVWNRSTLQVIRTMACEYALCSLFVPGDRQIIIGTKRGIVSGGADKMVKFWDFELVKDENSVQNSKRLTVNHRRTLQLDEDVLCVRYSPNQRLLAVSLLDCTVKLFYTDTLKFFLSLYGHKLPVLCLDISHDSALIATGSADRNVKIWGLDFGDCHRSLFAHDDSVMFLQFVQKTHLFFTAGKDKKIKQWDADKFEHIQTLEGHHREVWCLAVSPSGDHIVSSSHDKSLRLWERTREPIILEEEKEMQREAEFEESVGKGDEPVVPGETTGEAGLAGKKTIETIKAAERIMEALELYREESKKLEEHKTACEIAGKQLPPPTMSTILIAFGNISPSRYVLAVIRKVKSSELEESLLVLPFSYVPDLLTLFNEYIQNGLEVELICRCLFFLLRIHFGQITSNQMLLTVMDSLRTNTISRVKKIRDVLGFNMAGLQFLQREIESKEDVTFFADATDRFEDKKRKRKKRERAILAIA
ncbi:UNVERIFIED_CONTAM: hypothetical protein FKN15_065256 [Acipenser sinensis]